ncbi:MAG: tetratricopeptide repeat protein [Ignavibacteriae bacterium]|nr:tetratricopeptide repeat protein [Ignavibacteria bacterium]MBI3364221.1 tetratricopeptide repeat protein [Ignavibacteriota bacterium]
MILRNTILALAAVSGMLLMGCSSSEELHKIPPAPAQPSATEAMQKDLTTLRSENDSLRGVATRTEQDKRALAARVADLEMQLNDLKTKQPVAPPLEKKPEAVAEKRREIQPITNPRESYGRAIEAFRAKQYADAASVLQGIIDAGAPDGMEDNCYYWLGECAFAQKNYKDAIEHFAHVFSYERSEKKDDAQIMTANAYYAMGDKKKAKEEYETLVKKFPASPFVKKAKQRIAIL